MRHYSLSKTREDIKRKLRKLYSEQSPSYRDVLDFDKGYDFFSVDEARMLKYSSKWFNPDKYDHQQGIGDNDKPGQDDGTTSQIYRVCYDDGNYRNFPKNDSAWKLERLGCSANRLARDLEKLGRTPYHIGMEGEKFRVVAATLQKCNSPFVRRTFQFTSNGIIETPEERDEGVQGRVLPVIGQTSSKRGVTQKLVTIRRFRVIKKENLPGQNLVPHKGKITNTEKPRFLTVRIRSKERQADGEINSKKVSVKATPEVIRLTSSTEEEDFDYNEKHPASPSAQTEETDDGEEAVTLRAINDSDTIPVYEPKHDVKLKDDKNKDKEEADSNDTDEAPFDYEGCTKRFPDYQGFGQARPHQRQSCQVCPKRFLPSKMSREHPRTHHPHQRCSRPGGTAEDRIKTATSKFGRTRRVLNIAGLRTKYKML